MDVGIRGPSHLFGHSTDERIDAVNTELQYWDNNTELLTTKIVFGHYPLSFIASSQSGKHYYTSFANQSVSAYLCGHLHAKFSQKLWRKHTVSLAYSPEQSENAKQFWEWELGDWKETRMLRILAIDGGKVSFMDIDFRCRSKKLEDFEMAILITHPLDSRNMNSVNSKGQISRNDITVLVFSPKPVLNVTAKVYDSTNGNKLVEEVPLKMLNSSANSRILFTSKWNVENYISKHPTHYWMQVFVFDIDEIEIASTRRPFSIEGDSAQTTISWIVYLLLHIQWEKLYSILLWTNVTFLVILLAVPKIIKYFIEKDEMYQRWTVSVSSPFFYQLRLILFWIIWFTVEGSTNKSLWYSMAAYLLYLVRFPWFMGHATSENGEIATLFMSGWTMNSYKCSIKNMLGFPDVMAVTIPFMYLVVSPLFLLIYSLVAERSAFCLYSSGKQSISLNEHISTKTEFVGSNNSVTGILSSPKIHGGWIRKTIFSGCVFVIFIHFKVKFIFNVTYYWLV